MGHSGQDKVPMIGGNIPCITWKYYNYKALKRLHDYEMITG